MKHAGGGWGLSLHSTSQGACRPKSLSASGLVPASTASAIRPLGGWIEQVLPPTDRRNRGSSSRYTVYTHTYIIYIYIYILYNVYIIFINNHESSWFYIRLCHHSSSSLKVQHALVDRWGSWWTKGQPGRPFVGHRAHCKTHLAMHQVNEQIASWKTG